MSRPSISSSDSIHARSRSWHADPTPLVLASAVLINEPCEFCGVPDTAGFDRMYSVLRFLNVAVAHSRERDVVRIHAIDPLQVVPYELVSSLRAGVCLLGPLLARFHDCRVDIPGSSVIGDIPMDVALEGLRRLGAEATTEYGYIHARCTRLVGTDVSVDGEHGSRLFGSANLMMAATLAEGSTRINDAATDREIMELTDVLNMMGAEVSGAGTPIIRVNGVPRLHGVSYRLRMATSTANLRLSSPYMV